MILQNRFSDGSYGWGLGAVDHQSQIPSYGAVTTPSLVQEGGAWLGFPRQDFLGDFPRALGVEFGGNVYELRRDRSYRCRLLFVLELALLVKGLGAIGNGLLSGNDQYANSL